MFLAGDAWSGHGEVAVVIVCGFSGSDPPPKPQLGGRRAQKASSYRLTWNLPSMVSALLPNALCSLVTWNLRSLLLLWEVHVCQVSGCICSLQWAVERLSPPVLNLLSNFSHSIFIYLFIFPLETRHWPVAAGHGIHPPGRD